MSKKLSPASESTSNIRLSDNSAVTICSSLTPSRKRLQFLPNSKRSPRATSSACQVVSSFLRTPSIFLLPKSSAKNLLLPGESLAQYASFHLFRNGQSHQRQERRRDVQVIRLGERAAAADAGAVKNHHSLRIVTSRFDQSGPVNQFRVEEGVVRRAVREDATRRFCRLLIKLQVDRQTVFDAVDVEHRATRLVDVGRF